MSVSRGMLVLAVVCLASFSAAQFSDQLAAERVLGPHWRQISRASGMIFSGTVLHTEAQPADKSHPLPFVLTTFRVERPIAGVRAGEVLTIREWAGAWSMQRPMTRGQPSGSFTPIVITVQPGSDSAQDVLMRGSALASHDPASGSTYANPVTLPREGGWGAWMSGYGVENWLQFTAQANRTASVSVTAVDKSGQPTQNKLMPVIGIWSLSDLSGGPAPAATPVAFNTFFPGTTRLDAQFLADGDFRLGMPIPAATAAPTSSISPASFIRIRSSRRASACPVGR